MWSNLMILCYRGCQYNKIFTIPKVLNFSAKNLHQGKYRGVRYQVYRRPEAPQKLKYKVRYRGAYIKRDSIDLNQDLTAAALQIQNTIDRLYENGMNIEDATETVAQQIITRVRLNPYQKKNLLIWGQSLGNITVTDPVKTTVNRAMIAVSRW
jgi:Domain of unknown function (DUF4278)